MKAQTLAPLVGDLRQFASVRQVILDDGPERGQRALLFSTGGGLDFMVLVDRAMDIGTLSFRGLPLAWQSPAGLRSPWLTDLESEQGRGFNRSFSGFLVTCGLEHIRQPGNGSPLHGRLPGTPARLVAHGEAWDGDEPLLYCEGEVVQAAHGKECLRLRRRIEAPVGSTVLRIFDRVENIGPAASPHALLYHINFGYPAIGAEATVSLDGRTVLGSLQIADPNAEPAVTCLRAGAAPTARCVLASNGPAGETTIAFSSDVLPFAQFWTDLRPRIGVVAIEPCTSDRRADGTSEPNLVLQPGEARSYRLEISVRDTPGSG